MAEEPVTFERITKLYREESQKKSLTLLEPDFWEKVARYVAQLEADLAAARAKDPNSKAAMLLQDELRKVLQKREQIYQYRERKLGLLAGQIASGATTESRGLARPEPELLQKLVTILGEARTAVFFGPARNPPPTLAAASAAAGSPAPPGATPPPPKSGIVRGPEDVPPVARPHGTHPPEKEDGVPVHPTIAKVPTARGEARL